MNSEQRAATVREGATVLRWIEDQLRQHVQPGSETLHEFREVGSLVYRLEDALAADGHDQSAVYTRDAALSIQIGASDLTALANWEKRLVESTLYSDPILTEATSSQIAALAALHGLLQRYVDHEFMPPRHWLGVRDEGI